MPVYVNAFFDERVQQLFDRAAVVEQIFSSAGLEYRIVGGLAAYLYVEEAAPDAGRLTKDIDIVVRRVDLERIAKAAEAFGFEHRHVAGIDMLTRRGQPSERRAVHLVFARELREFREINGLRLIPPAELVRTKLTSFRLKDQMHLKDLDEAGLITAEVETALTPELRDRLARVRASD